MKAENQASGLFVTTECPKCKKKYQVKKSDTLKIYRCKICGHAVPVYPRLQQTRENISELLLIFCLFLLLVNPIKAIIEIIQIIKKLQFAGQSAVQLYNYGITDIMLNVFVMMTGLLAGYLLLKQRMGAIFLTKSFLIMAFFYTFFKIFYLLTHPDILFYLSYFNIFLLILFLISFGFWYAYIERSEYIHCLFEKKRHE